VTKQIYKYTEAVLEKGKRLPHSIDLHIIEINIGWTIPKVLRNI